MYIIVLLYTTPVVLCKSINYPQYVIEQLKQQKKDKDQ